MTSDSSTLSASTTHACVRCGAPTAIDRGLCERCNPLGLRDAASSQVHGTALLGVIAAIILLAVAARLVVAGVGPFEARVDAAVPAGEGLELTVSVTNTGTATGQSSCRVTDPTRRGLGPSVVLLSPQVEPGETVAFSRTVLEFGATPRALAVECPSP